MTGVLAALVTGALAAPAAGAASAASRPATGRVVVTGPGAAAGVRAAGATTVAAPLATFAVADVTAAQAAALARRGLAVTPDAEVTLDAAPSAAAEPELAHRYSVATLTGADRLATRGAGVTVAVVDSGVDPVPGLAGRVVAGADFTGEGFADKFGHGTFVAGLVAGDGRAADGSDTGIDGVATDARIVSVKVVDQHGRSTLSRVMLGLAWVVNHRDSHGIDVLNLSLSVKGAGSSYLYNPVNALVEAAWFSGITVVASAGNDGQDVIRHAPGNDPFVITVGSVTDHNTLATRDDERSRFSNSGSTVDGVAKPEVTSFGQHVRSTLPERSALAARQSVEGLPAGYGQLSGTSMSTAVVAGLAAIARQALGPVSPDEIKGRLAGTRARKSGVARLDQALAARSWHDGNQAYLPSVALAAAYAQLFAGTTDYASIDWRSLDWDTVPWTTATWTDATWTDATWTDATWTDFGWADSATWTDTATWTDSATWTDATWTE